MKKLKESLADELKFFSIREDYKDFDVVRVTDPIGGPYLVIAAELEKKAPGW